MSGDPDNQSTCDVLVIGAGVAGVCAAVASAREGADTLLIERNPYPGGTAISAMHRTVCGLYGTGPEPPTQTLNDGLAREIANALISRTSDGSPRQMGKVYVLPYRTQDLEAVLRELIANESYLKASYGISALGIKRTENRIDSVALSTGEPHHQVSPRYVIDCTGDGMLLQWAQAAQPEAPPTERQLAGFTVHISHLAESQDVLPITVPYALRLAANNGLVPDAMKYTVFYPGDDPTEGYCKLPIPPLPEEGRTARAHTAAETVLEVLSRTVPAFRDARLAATSPEVLDREGARLQGRYLLTEEDILQARSFPSSAARNAWPIERWLPSKGPRYQYLKSGTAYDIPFDCLRSQTITNLLAAGRCISVSATALGSTRVMGPCMTLGESAGRLAAQTL